MSEPLYNNPNRDRTSHRENPQHHPRENRPGRSNSSQQTRPDSGPRQQDRQSRDGKAPGERPQGRYPPRSSSYRTGGRPQGRYGRPQGRGRPRREALPSDVERVKKKLAATPSAAEGFKKFNLDENIHKGIQGLGYEDPSPIQEETIPHAISRKDIIGQAKTGTGKTTAFGIPLLHQIVPEEPTVQGLVLTPTRELAQQVAAELEALSMHTPIRILCVFGGVGVEPQATKLRQGVHVLVGTPGRILDHLERGNLNLSRVRVAILDEADRMLDMGFIDDVEKILKHTTADKRQTLLFSATMPEGILRLAHRHLKDPHTVKVSEDDLTVEGVNQKYVEVIDQREKFPTFMRILEAEKPERALIFAGTQRFCETLAYRMRDRNLSVGSLHGGMSQAQRNRVLMQFHEGKIQYLVATDVAARGLDIPAVSHVINYDIPRDPMDYVHRIGRTARVGKTGTAITIVPKAEVRQIWLIEHQARTKITKAEY
ncbi:putative ATP-dependent RNA helicase [uncultured archaeon]|nr:putative ATP-dependent RNA helicase [uncultured archaeon]